MIKIKSKIIVTICTILLGSYCLAQTEQLTTELPVDTIYFDLSLNISDQMISLDSLLEVAINNSPTTTYENASVERSVQTYKAQRFVFLEGFSGFYNITQGDQLNVVQSIAGSPILSNAFGVGTRYGVNLVLPISEVFTRPNRNKMLKAEIKMARSRKDEIIIELKRKIIADYFNMVAAQRTLNIRIQDFESARLSSEIASVEMKRGKITPQELARIKNQQAIIEANLELSKKEFMIAYYQLEVLVGVRLHNLKRVK